MEHESRQINFESCHKITPITEMHSLFTMGMIIQINAIFATSKFFTNPYCVYCILAGGDYMKTDFPVIAVDVETFQKMKKPCSADGYIIGVNEGDCLRDLFAVKERLVQFLPHTTIVIYFSGSDYKEGDFKWLIQVSHSRALKFILIQEEETLMIVWTELEIVVFNNKKVTSNASKYIGLNNNKYILNSPNKHVTFNNNDYLISNKTEDDLIKNNKNALLTNNNNPLFNNDKDALLNENYYNVLTNKENLQVWKPHFLNDTFKIGLFHFAPFVYIDDYGHFYKGIEKDILDQILSGWPVEHFVYGAFSWSHSLKELEKFNIDIALGAHWDIRVRTKNVEISYPYVQVCLKFLVPKPTLTNKMGMFFKPFAYLVWIVLLGTAIVLSVFIYNVNTRIYKLHNINYCRIYLDVVLVFFSNPLPQIPSKIPMRIIFIISFTMTIMLTTAYSARLVTFLVSPSYTKPINTMKDMLEAGIKWYLVPEERPNWDILDKSADSLLIHLFNTTTPTKTPKMAVATNLVPDRYITDLYSIYDNKDGQWKVASQCVGAYYMVFPMQKNSPYLKFFDVSLKRLVEHGHVEYLIFRAYNSFELQKLMQPFFDNYPERYDKNVYIDLSSVLDVFKFLLCGLSASGVMFLFECYNGKYGKYGKAKNKC